MKLLMGLLILLGFSLSGDLEKDRQEIYEMSKKLAEVEYEIEKGNLSVEIIDKLNAYGYPIYRIYNKYKYYKDKGENYHKLYGLSKRLYERYLYVKRTIFPKFVEADARRNHLPVCSVELAGKEKRKIIVRVKNPYSDAEIMKVYENTQLYYANRLGFEVIDFQPCK